MAFSSYSKQSRQDLSNTIPHDPDSQGQTMNGNMDVHTISSLTMAVTYMQGPLQEVTMRISCINIFVLDLREWN